MTHAALFLFLLSSTLVAQAPGLSQVLIKLKFINLDDSAAAAEYRALLPEPGAVALRTIQPTAGARLFADTRLSVVSAPSFLTNLGQSSTLSMAGDETIPWLEKQRDGSYRMREASIKTNLEVVATPTGTVGGSTTHIKLDIARTGVVRRTPLERDAKAIGRPKTGTREATIAGGMKSSHYAVARGPSLERGEPMLVVVNVRVLGRTP